MSNVHRHELRHVTQNLKISFVTGASTSNFEKAMEWVNVDASTNVMKALQSVEIWRTAWWRNRSAERMVVEQQTRAECTSSLPNHRLLDREKLTAATFWTGPARVVVSKPVQK